MQSIYQMTQRVVSLECFTIVRNVSALIPPRITRLYGIRCQPIKIGHGRRRYYSPLAVYWHVSSSCKCFLVQLALAKFANAAIVARERVLIRHPLAIACKLLVYQTQPIACKWCCRIVLEWPLRITKHIKARTVHHSWTIPSTTSMVVQN